MPPPVFSLTPTQRSALAALDWLHDWGEEHRRSGRSWVIAMSCVRRLVLGNVPPNGTLDVEDHIPGTRSSSVPLDYVRQIAEQLRIDIVVNPRTSQVRLGRPLGARRRVSILEALTVFGDRDNPDPVPTYTPRLPAARTLTTFTVQTVTRGHTNKPTKSIWDIIDEDLTGV